MSYYNTSTTDNKEELLIQVDENDNIIGPIKREYCHNQKDIPWHRTTHTYILNSNGELLLTKRSSTKDTAPNQIVISNSGHVRYGEESIQAAKREMFEELGLNIDLKYITKYKVDYGYEKEFVYVYFGITDEKPKLFTDEVIGYMYIDLDEFKEQYTNGEIVFPPGAKDVCDLLLKDDLLSKENFD
jgi:isopentenyl-diphosphate delta-isomerase type 1